VALEPASPGAYALLAGLFVAPAVRLGVGAVAGPAARGDAPGVGLVGGPGVPAVRLRVLMVLANGMAGADGVAGDVRGEGAVGGRGAGGRGGVSAHHVRAVARLLAGFGDGPGRDGRRCRAWSRRDLEVALAVRGGRQRRRAVGRGQPERRLPEA